MLKKIIFRGLMVAAASVLGIVGLAQVNAAHAGSGKFTTTKLPYWNVGQFNGALSDACQQNLFNQKKVQNLNIGYLGKTGMGVTGIAMLGWNLHDPQGLAKENITYHFFNDGYSNCKVFIARARRRQ